MSESEVIAGSKNGPVTLEWLKHDLSSLGLEPGMTVIVHTALSALGWISGGAQTLINALVEIVRPYGNIVMPAHSGNLSDPSGWKNPPVPESWWDTIRETMPAFDPDITPTHGVGRVAELFRTWPHVIRSNHPQVSFAAWGESSIEITASHELDYGLGERSPVANVYKREGWVLLLGIGHESNSSLHLAEVRAQYAGKKFIRCGSPVILDGHRRWKQYDDIDYNSDDFETFGRDFVRENKDSVRVGTVGYAKCQLFSQPYCVDYAVRWFERKRK